jgi:hypothetical protein
MSDTPTRDAKLVQLLNEAYAKESNSRPRSRPMST